jgi:sulfonate dioxygenase
MSSTQTFTAAAESAPSAAKIQLDSTPTPEISKKDVKTVADVYKDFDGGPAAFKLDKELNGDGEFGRAKYPHYLPTWNPEQKYPPLEEFEYIERGKGADPELKALLGGSETKTRKLTPNMGTEIRGLQLSSLNEQQKNELALAVAQRKVVVFRDQDFADLPIEKAKEFGAYFGRHHIHPTSGTPAGHPEIHLVHRGANDESFEKFFSDRLSSVAWHSDVSYEKQPAGTTFLYILDSPEVGGDTIFIDAATAYRRLSPEFQKRLHGLRALHSGIEQVQSNVARGGINRRDAVATYHPIVRTHPATGEKALFINQSCKF